MFIYFCEHCSKFNAFKSKTGSFTCPDCGNEYLPLLTTVDEWNNFSNDEMLDAIEQAQNPIEIKKPVFDRKQANKQEEDSDDNIESVDLYAEIPNRHTDSIHVKPTNRNHRSVPWMIVSIVSLILGLVGWLLPFPAVTITLTALAVILAIISLVKRCKLRAIAIISLIVAGVLLSAWIIKGSTDLVTSRLLGIGEDSESKNVSFGRVTVLIPGENWENVKTYDRVRTFATKNNSSTISMGVEDNALMSDSHFENCREDLIKNLTSSPSSFGTMTYESVTDSHYVDIGELKALVVATKGTIYGQNAICKGLIINDPEENQIVILLHEYLEKDKRRYDKVFEKIIDSATIKPRDTSKNNETYNNSSNNYDTSKVKEVEFADLKYQIPEYDCGYSLYRHIINDPIYPGVYGREIIYISVELDDETKYMENYTDADINKVNATLKEVALAQMGRFGMPEPQQTEIKESFEKNDKYVYYQRNYNTTIAYSGDYGIRTLTYYTNDTEDKVIVVLIYGYNKGSYSNDGIFEEIINSTGESFDLLEMPEEESVISKDTSNGNGGVDPELKAALDDYERFMDKYAAFMKKYNSDPNNAVNMMVEYADMVAQYAQYVEKIDVYERKKNEMSKEDLKYFTDVINRVEKKMIDAM